MVIRKCQWIGRYKTGCKEDATKRSYCEQHYAICYQVGSAPKPKYQRHLIQVGWGRT